MYLEFLARIVLSSSNCQVVLHVAVSDPLLPTWMSLILSSSCWFSLMSPPDASACRTATCSSAQTRALVLSLTRSFSATVFVCIHPCLSRQGSLNNRSDSFCTFVVDWFDRSSMRSQRRTTRATSSVTASLDVSRKHVESAWLNLWNSFHHNPWQWRSRSFFVTYDFLCRFQTKSNH